MAWKIGSLLLVLFLSFVKSENILFLLGVACSSHHFWNRALINGLAARGHNLTILSADLEENSNNTHYIHLDNLYPTYYDGSSDEALDFNAMSKSGVFAGILEYYNFGIQGCKGAVSSKGFEFLKTYPKDFKFDLVIHDFTIGPCLLGFLDLFDNPPLIGLTAFNNPPFSVRIVGGHKQMAYVPHYLLNYDTNMNLYQRVINIGLYLIDELYRHVVAYPLIGKTMEKGFGRPIKDLFALEAQHRLLLVNSHVAVDFPESLPPNIIAVGGMQIARAQPLPNDISEFISQGQRGTILFIIGSIFQADSLGDEILDKFIEAFRSLPEYNFLWKFESDKIEKRLPKNVMTRPWLPQNDVLAHGKILAFITHSGLLSTHEAFWHGVPIIAVPLFSDQHRNAHKSVAAGVGEKLDIYKLNTEDIVLAIRRVVEDKRYTDNMKTRSKLFRDQQESPLDRAVWWTEWILRNPDGPEVMKTPVLEMGFIAANSWDIILLVIANFILLPYIGISFLIFVGRYLTRRSRNKKKLD